MHYSASDARKEILWHFRTQHTHPNSLGFIWVDTEVSNSAHTPANHKISAQTKFILSHIEKLLFKWTRLSLKPLGLQSRLLLWIFMTWTIKESYFQSILGLQAYPEELLPASEWCSWLGEESQASTSPIAHMAQWVTQDTAWSSPAAAGAPFIRCSGFPSTASSVLLPNKRYKFHSEKHSWLYSFYPHLHWRSS